MKILDKLPEILNQKFPLEQYKSTLYPISKEIVEYTLGKLQIGKTIFLYSGSHRFNYDAIYIEPKVFSNITINWHPNTIFIDVTNKKLLDYTLSRINPSNLLILNSVIFIKYRHINDILKDIDQFKKTINNVIVSIPLARFDFNRLKYSYHEICKIVNGCIVDNTLVICR